MSVMMCPLPVNRETLRLRCAPLRVTLAVGCVPGVPRNRCTTLFQTPVPKEILYSGVTGNVVRMDVPDTPRMNPGYLVILSLRRISLLGGSTLITFFVDTHSARYQRDSFTAPQKTRLVQGCVRLLTDDNGPFAHTRQRRFFECGSY